MAITNPYTQYNTTNQYIQDPNNPMASIKNTNYIAPQSVANTPIVADNLNLKQTQAQVSSGMTDANSDLYKSILAGTTSLMNNFNTYLTEQKTKEADITSANAEPEWLKKYLEAPAPTNPLAEGGTYETMYGMSGIEGKQEDVLASKKLVNEGQNELNAVNAQLQQITDQAKVEELQMKQEGINQAGAQARNITRERNLAIQALPLQAKGLLAQAKIAIAQNNESLAQNALSQAQEALDKKFNIQLEYEKSLQEFYQSQRDAVLQYANDNQKNALEQQRINDEREFEISKMNYQNELQMQRDDLQYQYDASLKQLNPASTETGLSSNAQAVIDNPNLLNSYTATVKGKVIAELQNAGYDTSNLGVKPLSETAITAINQTDFALSSLNDLKSTIESNLQYIGPIKGLSVLNPWSKARQVQATIDRVKQTVGKALEGGVLRKEDEEKYKKILATITDTPETAIYKINQLIDSITRNKEDYALLQQQSGKSSNVSSSLQKKGSTSSGQTSTGNSYTITKE